MKRAEYARDTGDSTLAIYLFLAAFEEASGTGAHEKDAVEALKEAWVLACSEKERSMSEYIFEKLEPYLSPEEIIVCADELQNMTLDKLEEFGLPRSELEDMAQMISEDIFGGLDSPFHIDHIISGHIGPSSMVDATKGEPTGNAAAPLALSDENNTAADAVLQKEYAGYAELPGYIDAVRTMRDLGIGSKDDPDYSRLVDTLNRLHGLPKSPSIGTILLRADAREDANNFMMSTLCELGLPSVHMRMEENYQGMPLLCVSAQASDLPPNGAFKDILSNAGVLVLQDIDCWESPLSGSIDDGSAFFMMQLTRGAREAVAMMRSAIEDPNVHVIVTASDISAIDEFFLDLLDPITLIEIGLPTVEERRQIWDEILESHPSIRGINRDDLVRLTANMPRVDIYSAVREAIEEAYKTGLVSRRYHPVTRFNLFDKIAAYQPLDSTEYSELEEEVISDFRRDIACIDDLLDI